MAGILDTVTSLVSSGLADKASRALDVEPSMVQSGLGTIAPIVLGAIAKKTATPADAGSFIKSLPKETGGDLLSTLSGLLMGGDAQRQQASSLEGIFGAGTNAIGATLSQKLGFNVRPLLSMAVPLVLGVISRTVKSQNLNAQGFSDLVRNEADTFIKNPANKETAALVHTALAASDKANQMRQMYDEGEWLKVRNGPLTALYHVATSSMSGPVGLSKEFTAAADAVVDATKSASAESLLGTAFGTGLPEGELMQLAKDRPEPRTLLDGLHETYSIVARKNPVDAKAYRDMVMTAARKAAEASKEGGFLGFGGTKVSDAEQRALDEIQRALS